jgi:hypothetical protein
MMKRIKQVQLLWCSLLFYSVVITVVDATKWKQQSLPTPENSRGEHTGVAIYDVNGDGYDDVLFAAGRHSVDQSYALINLGKNENSYTIRFSEAISLGRPGGFYQIDASSLSSLEEGHVAVLLAGGTCSVEKMCQPGSNQSAIVLDVSIQGCSVNKPDRKCRSTVIEIWRDGDPAGDRNGAFAPTLGNNGALGDPAIVLAGRDCIKIFEPNADGTFPTPPTFVVIPQNKVTSNNNKTNNVDRAAGLAVGYVGDRPGLIAGLRTSRPPSPLGKLKVLFDESKFLVLSELFGRITLMTKVSFPCSFQLPFIKQSRGRIAGLILVQVAAMVGILKFQWIQPV